MAVLIGNVSRAQFIWDGTSSFAAAVGSNTLGSGSTLSITTTHDHDFSATALVNNGTINWNAGRLR